MGLGFRMTASSCYLPKSTRSGRQRICSTHVGSEELSEAQSDVPIASFQLPAHDAMKWRRWILPRAGVLFDKSISIVKGLRIKAQTKQKLGAQQRNRLTNTSVAFSHLPPTTLHWYQSKAANVKNSAAAPFGGLTAS